MDLQIEFPVKMPKEVRDQIILESKAMAQGVLGDYKLTNESLKDRLVQNFAKMKIGHYNKINDANESANCSIKIYQDRVDELQRQVDNLKMKIR